MSTFTIPTIFTAIDKMTAPIRKMEQSVENFGKAAFKVGRQAAFIGLAVATPLFLAAKSASEFENKMGNISTLVDTNVESMSKMGDELLSLSTKMPVTIDDLTLSLYDIRSAGISAGSAMSVLENSSILAVAGLSTASEATNIMTSAINAFKDENLTAAQISDIFFKTVKAGKTTVAELSQSFGATAPIIQSAGVKLADFQAATAALTTVGTPATQAQTQLRAAVVALQKPTIEMEKIFKKLGVTTGSELIKKYDGLGGAFKAVNKASEELNVNNAKAWSSTEALAGVTSLAGATNQKYIETLEDMVKGSNAIMEAFEKQKQKNSNQTQILKNNIEALSITIGNFLLPTINETMESLQPVIESFIKWARDNKGLMTTILKIVGGVAALSFAISGVAFVLGGLSKLFYVGKAAMVAYNVAYGAYIFLAKKSAFFVMGNAVALQAYTAVQWLANAALYGFPLVWVVGAFIAVGAAIVALIVYWEDMVKWVKESDNVFAKLIRAAIYPIIQAFKIIGAVISLIIEKFAQLNKWIQTSDSLFAKFARGVLAEISTYFTNIGIGIEVVIGWLSQLWTWIEKMAGGALEPLMAMIDMLSGATQKELGVQLSGEQKLTKELINPKVTEQEGLSQRLENTTTSNVNLNVNDPNKRATVQAENLPPNVRIGTTVGG